MKASSLDLRVFAPYCAHQLHNWRPMAAPRDDSPGNGGGIGLFLALCGASDDALEARHISCGTGSSRHICTCPLLQDLPNPSSVND